MSVERATAIESLVGGVVAAQLWGEGDPDALLSEERALVPRAVEGRLRQFAAGRQCARAALAALGVAPVPILRARDRAPSWPPGIIGSISHTEGYALALVARPGPALSGVGVDTERVGRVRDELQTRLFTERERAWLAELAPADRAVVATELFGLKEAYYKAQHPLTAAWVGFHDVEMRREADHWVLDRAAEIAALDAVRWPCRGRTVVQAGVAVAVVTVSTAGDSAGA